MQELHRNSNAAFRLVYHLVLTTKYRRKVLTVPVLDRAREILTALASAWDGSLIECSGEADHLHALLDLPPKARPSDVVNNLKTVTSRRLRSEFPSLCTAYDRRVLWSPSYCLISVGDAADETIKQYIEAQDGPT